MIFKEFSVDYNKVVIDGQIIHIPHYMSTTQWMDFWSFCEDANSGRSIDERVNSEVSDYISSAEDEHAEELEREIFKLKEEFNDRLEDVASLVEERFELLNSIDDKINSLKFKQE